MFVHNTFKSVCVAEWPPLRKSLPTRLAMFSLCILSIYDFVISRFGFEHGVWFLIVSVPVHCLLVTWILKLKRLYF